MTDAPVLPCDWIACDQETDAGVAAGRRGTRWLCPFHLAALRRWAHANGLELNDAAARTPALSRSRQRRTA